MSAKFEINGFQLSDHYKPYIIAEVGVNHEGCIERAMQLIESAAMGGANAVKFQSYKAEKIASRNSPAYWDIKEEPTQSQYELFSKYDAFGEEEYRQLAEHCARNSVDFLATPFDLDSVNFLNPIVPAFKIASADITNVPLIRKCASTQKPLIISTGASTLSEIKFAVEIARNAGAVNIALLHCVLNYPTPIERAQLSMISTLKTTFPECSIGYSDHVIPDESITSLQVSVLLGATIIEKHFTNDKSMPGNDHYHAMDQKNLEKFCKKVSTFQKIISAGIKNMEFEQGARLQARRSVIAANNIKAGDMISESDIIAKRPAHGISPIYWDDVLGREALEDIEKEDLIQWSMLSGKVP